jgi:hypothetical protein
MRKLRRFMDAEELKSCYGKHYDPTVWPEHMKRIEATKAFIQRLVDDQGLKTAADYSAGGTPLMASVANLELLETSDYSLSGRDIIDEVRRMEPVDLYVCTETIEHLECPWTLIEEVARKTRWLVLSTPLDEPWGSGNWEHYWGFTLDDVRTMLEQSGISPMRQQIVHGENWTYAYQLWAGVVIK